MKNTHLLLVVLGLLLSTDLAAETLPSVNQDEVVEPALKVHASLRPRLELRSGHLFGEEAADVLYGPKVDSMDLFSQQSRVGVSLNHGQVHSRATVQFAQVWGAPVNTQLHPFPIQLYEGFIDYAFLSNLKLQAGRFEIAYGEERVLGSVGWSQVGRTWDGLRLKVGFGEDHFVHVFGARHIDGGAGTEALVGDAYLSGVYSRFGKLGPVAELDIYALADTHFSDFDTDAAHQEMLFTFGVRSKTVVKAWDLVVEAAIQGGTRCLRDVDGVCLSESQDAFAWFAEAQSGYKFGQTRTFVGGSVASGDNPDTETNEAFDQLYPTGHAHVGWMDFFPRSNIVDIYAGVNTKFEWMSFTLKLHEFQRLEPEMVRLGNELDFQLTIPLSDSVAVDAGMGLFLAAEGMSATEEANGLATWTFASMRWSY